MEVVTARLRQNETIFLHPRGVDEECDDARMSLELRRGCHCGGVVGGGWARGGCISGRGVNVFGRSWQGVMVGVDDGVGVLLGVGVAVSVTTGRMSMAMFLSSTSDGSICPQTAP